MGSVIKKAPLGVASLIPGVNDLVLGKQDPGTPDVTYDTHSAEAKEVSKNALNEYNNQIKNIDGIVNSNITGQENQILQNQQDQAMRAQDMVAQRGLSDSSIGISAILNQSKGIDDKINSVRANRDALKSGLLDNASQGISKLMVAQDAGKAFKWGTPSQGRVGGIAPLLGAGIGGYFGGPQGAQMGMGMGQVATKIN